MTPDAKAHPPAVPPGHWVECPLCHEFFRNEQARGSHLHYVHHQSSARKVRPRFEAPPKQELPAAAMALPEAPPKVAPAPQPAPPVETPKPTPTPPRSEAKAPAPRSPEPQPTSPPTSRPAPPAIAPTPAPASVAPQQQTAPAKADPPSSPEGALLAALGLGVGGIAALVLANKGKNAPPGKAPAQAEPARPPARLPDGIWAQPEAIQPSGIEYVDRMLGYSGLPKPRRRLWG